MQMNHILVVWKLDSNKMMRYFQVAWGPGGKFILKSVEDPLYESLEQEMPITVCKCIFILVSFFVWYYKPVSFMEYNSLGSSDTYMHQ